MSSSLYNQLALASILSLLATTAWATPAPTTTTLLTSPAGSATFGQPVTLTASVVPSSATGTVTFYDGTTMLGAGPVVGGQAMLKTGQLAAGRRRLTARYNGDSLDAASLSSATQLTLTPVPGNTFTLPPTAPGNKAWVTTGDFNGDGKIDFVTEANSAIVVLLANGDGSVRASSPSALPPGISGLQAVGDFNNDGKADLIVSDSSTTYVMLGNGDGTFQTAMPLNSVGTQFVARFWVVGDFNGDGIADLAATSNQMPGVTVMLGNGDGTFSAPMRYGLSVTYAEAVLIGDFNGDGKPDLAIASFAGSMNLLIGTGTGSFLAAVPYGTNLIGIAMVGLAAGDLNGDGFTDIVAACPGGGSLQVYLGKGDGTFNAPVMYSAGYGPEDVAITDINGDGKPDLVASDSSASKTYVLLGNGDGTFQPASSYLTGGAYGLTVGDFNGDGRVDLALDNIGIIYGALSTTTTLTASPASANLGKQITLTATVSAPVSNGQITFYDGLSVLGVSPMVSGQAVFKTSLLATGGHSFKAVFSGATPYTGSTSNASAITIASIGGGGFSSGTSYPAGANPQAAAFGDFNGDGKPDLALANGSGNSVSILLGSGNGAFSQPVNYAAGSAPRAVAVGDFNGDGKQDVAVVNSAGNNVSVLLGNGDGTFQPQATYGVGTAPSAIVVWDVNLDGKEDLIIANTGSNSVSVLYGNGDGTFQAPVNTSTQSPPVFLTMSDIDGDGKADLVIAGGTGVTVIFSFTQAMYPQVVNTDAGASVRWVAIGDFNLDGRPDLAIATANGISLLINKGGQGMVVPPFSLLPPLLTGADCYSVAVGDFNGDGIPDLAAANRGGNTVSLLLGYGDGQFQSPVNFAVGQNPVALALADLNGDGRADLAVVNSGSNNLTVLLGAPPSPSSITLTAAPATSLLGQPVTLTANVSPAAASGKIAFYNGTTVLGVGTLVSGQATLTTRLLPVGHGSLTARYTGDAIYLKATSNPVAQTVNSASSTGFAAPATYGGLTTPMQVISGDFNADGITDLIVMNENQNGSFNGSFSVFLGKGDGTFQAPLTNSAPFDPSFIAASDFNGDGKADLLVASGGVSSLSIYLGNGDGTFRLGFEGAGPPFPGHVVVADFNGDGKADLAVYGMATIQIWLGIGDGNFLAPLSVSAGGGPMIAGDFNGDGKADLAFTVDTTLTILLGNGDGTFQPALNTTLNVLPTALAGADLNGDGKLDLVAVGSNTVTVFLGRGDGTFAAPSSFPARNTLNDVSITDINGDGKLDLAMPTWNGSIATDGLTLMLGNGDGTFQSPVTYNTGLSPTSLVAGDFNGDGRTDLAVVHQGSYMVANSYTMTVLLGRSTLPTGPPFGVLDTPANNSMNISGAVAVTGWALSPNGAVTVGIYRDPLPGEPAQPNGYVFLGNAFFVSGARPDIARGYPNYPSANSAGWGMQVLTTMLPGTNGQSVGNGTYKLHAIATDPFGASTELGAATIAVNNAASKIPFGTIDTPGQGATISGGQYLVFGWALSPQPNMIPTDGSTVSILIDNQLIGHPRYNQNRCDIGQLFPGLKNSGSADCAQNGLPGGPVGSYILDTTRLADGLHTMAWTVTDSAGNSAGLGSRYFIVQQSALP